MFSNPLSFRRSLVLNITILLVLLGCALLVTEFVTKSHLTRKLANIEATNAIATVEQRNVQFIEPIEVLIDVFSYRMSRGLFPDEWLRENLDGYFQPFIEIIPHLSSINLADGSGDSYLLLRVTNGWRSRISKPRAWGQRVKWREWTDTDPRRKESWSELEYDARSRPWYKNAVALIKQKGATTPVRHSIHWTRPYEFFTTKQPGVTASVAVDTPGGGRFVLALDILLEDVSKYTTQLRVGEAGRVFVVAGALDSDDSALIGLPFDPRLNGTFDMRKYILRPPNEFGGPVADFIAHLSQERRLTEGLPVEFHSSGVKWWGMARRWKIFTENPLWVGMVISQEDLLQGIPDLTPWVIGLTMFFVLLAVLRGIRLARTFSEPMEGLVHQGERMQRLNFQPTEPVKSNIVEIRQLATTLERMRQALYSFSSVREDIRIAHSIRRAILPAPLPTMTGFEIEAWSEPSSEVGGEAYDVVDFWGEAQPASRRLGPPDGVALFIFDAAGLGVNTAVKGSQLRAIFRTGVRLGVELPALAEQMNQFLRNDSLDTSPVRSWYGRLNRTNSQLTSLSLGHEPVLWYIAAQRRFERLDTPSPALGFEAHIADIPSQAVRLSPGDIVVIASDGVVDTMSPNRERFGTERIRQVITEHQNDNGKQILDQLRQALIDFAADGVSDEDRTLVLIKCI